MPCFEDGLNCLYYHKVKQEELFILLRGYHCSEEVYALLRSIIDYNDNFKDFIFRYYSKVNDVSEFAALAHMSVRNFQRKFKSEFHCSVRMWLVERRAESVLWGIRCTDKRISELASDYGFSTPSSFTTFCKRHFSLTPSELRRQPFPSSPRSARGVFPDFSGGGFFLTRCKKPQTVKIKK